MGHPLLTWNPQLPQPAPGSYIDTIFVSERARLVHEISDSYRKIIEQTGGYDDNGNFIQGGLETEAGMQRASIEKQRLYGIEDVTKNAQDQGRTWSGTRQRDEAQVRDQFDEQKAQLEFSLSRQLGSLYSDASALLTDFRLRQNDLIAAAAGRQITESIDNPGTGSTDPGAGGGAGAGGAPGQPAPPPTSEATGGPTQNPQGEPEPRWNQQFDPEEFSFGGQAYQVGDPAANRRFFLALKDYGIKLERSGVGSKFFQQMGLGWDQGYYTDLPQAKQFLNRVGQARNTLHGQVIEATKKKGFDWAKFKKTPLWLQYKALGGS